MIGGIGLNDKDRTNDIAQQNGSDSQAVSAPTVENKLWTKDFTIITIGSMISMVGNTMAGFAASLFVLDYTQEPAYYAFYVFLYTLPQILSPILSGPLMDRFSRRRTIYMLDFISAGIYTISGILIYLKFFNFGFLALMTFIIGTINSVYSVAYSSFYPLLISEGNYSKAYSIASTLETLTFVVVPIATFLYKSFGIFPLLLANGACFFLAGSFEVRISDVEALSLRKVETDKYDMKKYFADTKDGIKYLFSEKALLLVALYFTFSAFSGGASGVMTLPWFKETFENGEYIFMSVAVFMMLGRMVGGLFHYKVKLPTNKKFSIALIVYICISLIEGVYLYASLNVMRLACLIMGLMGVTSYNIRISATQSYVPNDWKGRFNGAFIMLNTVGTLLGQLCAGALVNFLPMRVVLSLIMTLCAISAVIFIGGGKKYVAPLYNRQS